MSPALTVTGVAVYHGIFSGAYPRCGHHLILTTNVGRVDAWSFDHPRTMDELDIRLWVLSQVRCHGYLIKDDCPMHVEAELLGHDGT